MKASKTMKDIQFLIKNSGLDLDETLKRTKLILGLYPTICWVTAERANDLQERLLCQSKELDVSLEFFIEYIGRDKENEQISKIRSLFHTRWLIDIVNTALMKIKAYPIYGETYHNIISSVYTGTEKSTEQDMLSALNIDRSIYYARKKEALLLVGYCIWGDLIPSYMENNLYSDSTLIVS